MNQFLALCSPKDYIEFQIEIFNESLLFPKHVHEARNPMEKEKSVLVLLLKQSSSKRTLPKPLSIICLLKKYRLIAMMCPTLVLAYSLLFPFFFRLQITVCNIALLMVFIAKSKGKSHKINLQVLSICGFITKVKLLSWQYWWIFPIHPKLAWVLNRSSSQVSKKDEFKPLSNRTLKAIQKRNKFKRACE